MRRHLWSGARIALLMFGILTLIATVPGSATAAQPGTRPGLGVPVALEPLALHPAIAQELMTGHDAEAQPGGPWQLAQSRPAPARTPAGGPAATSAADNLAEVGAKLSNPVSNIWAMFTQFNVSFSDGDINTGDPEVGFNMQFQPILPVPLFGTWKLIVRPTVPILFTQPVPQNPDDFDHKSGLGDTLLPLLVSPPAGNWLLGLGPTFTLPTSTVDEFGRQQWAVGPAGVLGYKTKKITMGVFPQYFFGVADRGGERPNGVRKASYMSMLYFFFYNLPDAWQVGFNPSISFDDKATPKTNQWNVPVGLTVAKTTKIGKQPVKFQLGFEYSVVSENTFGQRFQMKLNVIPVIPSLIKKPVFGGTS